MPVEVMAGKMHGLFVDRCGDQSRDLTGKGHINGPDNVLVARLPRGGLHDSRTDGARRDVVQVKHLKHSTCRAGLLDLLDAADLQSSRR